jgi:hypothetical protein
MGDTEMRTGESVEDLMKEVVQDDPNFDGQFDFEAEQRKQELTKEKRKKDLAAKELERSNNAFAYIHASGFQLPTWNG